MGLELIRNIDMLLLSIISKAILLQRNLFEI